MTGPEEHNPKRDLEDLVAECLERTDLYGPEVGMVGLVLNLLFAAGLWSWLSRWRQVPA